MHPQDIKILIVEDEEDQRIRLKYVLESEGYQVTEAESGKEAVKLIDQKDQYFNIVITDLKMPGDIDGESVLRETKKISPKTEVMIVTAYGSVDSSVRAMINGAFDYIQKPLNMPELRIKIERILMNQEMISKLEGQEIDEGNSKVIIKELIEIKEKLIEIHLITKNIKPQMTDKDKYYSEIKKIAEISQITKEE